MSFTGWVTAQPIKESILPVEIVQSPEDVQAEVRALKECDVDQRELARRREQDALKDQRIGNLEKELELSQKEVELKDKILAVKDMEIAAQGRAFNDMKEVTDRALKLAESQKPKSNILPILGGILAAFLIGLSLGL